LNTQTITKQEGKMTPEALNDLIIDSIQDIKGKKILKLDLRKLDEAPADFFIICEGDSNTQTKAIADNVYLRVKKEGNLMPISQEGQQSATWICIDYFNVVVHVFHKETRTFYELEDLWSDAVFSEYDTL
jgi:ribosome-associated protein